MFRTIMMAQRDAGYDHVIPVDRLLLRIDAQAVAHAKRRQSEADHSNHETGDFRKGSSARNRWSSGATAICTIPAINVMPNTSARPPCRSANSEGPRKIAV